MLKTIKLLNVFDGTEKQFTVGIDHPIVCAGIVKDGDDFYRWSSEHGNCDELHYFKVNVFDLSDIAPMA